MKLFSNAKHRFIHGHEISKFILDIDSRATKEEVIAVVQSYYLKYTDMFIRRIEHIPFIVEKIWDDTSPDVVNSRQYILAQTLTNYRRASDKEVTEWDKFLGIKDRRIHGQI